MVPAERAAYCEDRQLTGAERERAAAWRHARQLEDQERGRMLAEEEARKRNR